MTQHTGVIDAADHPFRPLTTDGPSVRRSRSPLATRSCRRGRWNAWLHLVLFAPTVVVFVLMTVGLATIPVTVGFALLAVSLPAGRWLGNVHRHDAGLVLGQPVPAPYRPVSATGVGRLLQRLRDPQTWRDLLWMLASMTVGFTLSMLSIGLFLAIGWYLAMPLLFGITSDVLDFGYGIIHFESVADGFLLWSHAALAAALWWFGSPWLMRLRAGLDRALLGPTESERVRLLRERVDTLAETRSEAADIQAAELRRIERDLHDGAQARLVSSGMTLGMAIEVLDEDPAVARAMLQEAQTTTRDALADLRTVVRGIHPPVLADRGLVGAVRALAEQMPVSVQVTSTLDGRPPAPVESAAYFAIAECLANVGKHAHATHALVDLRHDPGPAAASPDTAPGEAPGTAESPGAAGVLTAVVEDDGVGGARHDPAGGLAGIERRLAVFDGTLDVVSPPGGPTRITLTLPCDLSDRPSER